MKFIKIIIIILILLAILIGIAIFAIPRFVPGFKNEEITNKTNLVINNNNVTSSLKNDIIIKNDVIYLSKPDLTRFFDSYLFYDEKDKRIITTYTTNVTSLTINDNNITINDEKFNLSAPAINIDNTIYLPFSLMEKSYNADIKYITNTDTVIVETFEREKTTAEIKNNTSVKSRTRTFSRTVDKVKKGNTIIIISNESNGWTKIRTENGKIGYIKESNLTNIQNIREKTETQLPFKDTVKLVWDNFYVSAPDRSGTTIPSINVVSPTFFVLEKDGKGEIKEKIGQAGLNYINWAKSNNYQVWALISNINEENMLKTTSEIMNSFENRSRLINNILNIVKKYNLDGINIDFEYMYDEDSRMFTQFLVELYPRLQELNVILSVDVTAPDGGERYSLCYNRHDIANNCDYIIFMAYDQYTNNSPKAGSTAAFDWMKVSLNKFLTTEEIKPNKIILALPFYTRIWTENNSGKITSSTVIDIKNIDKNIPNNAKKIWLENEKQYYVEYTRNNSTYKIWIEDERSFKEKLLLVNENKLGGAAFWAKDRESKEIWDIVDETLK